MLVKIRGASGGCAESCFTRGGGVVETKFETITVVDPSLCIGI